jgi:hypothetical protein
VRNRTGLRHPERARLPCVRIGGLRPEPCEPFRNDARRPIAGYAMLYFILIHTRVHSIIL